MNLDELDGIGPITLKRLNEAGIKTPKDLIAYNPVKITELSPNIKIEQAEKWFNAAMQYLQERGELLPPLRTAREILEERKKVERISTGSRDLDDILFGGIEVGSSTEVYGEFKSGKSQLCHTLAVIAQLPKELCGVNGRVLWVDSENTFRPERIREIIIARGLVPLKPQSKEDKKAGKLAEPENEKDVLKFLDRIEVAKPLSSSHQHTMIEHIGDFINREAADVKKNDPQFRLLIIDSLTKYWRGEYLGRGQLNARQIGINEHVMLISKLPELYKIAVIYTNQVTSTVEPFGDPIRAVGGNIVGHANTYRIYMKKAGSKHIARIIDSPYHPDTEVQFDLGSEGIINFVEKK